MLTVTANSASPFTTLVSDATSFATACATPVPGLPVTLSTASTEAQAATEPLSTATLAALAASEPLPTATLDALAASEPLPTATLDALAAALAATTAPVLPVTVESAAAYIESLLAAKFAAIYPEPPVGPLPFGATFDAAVAAALGPD